MLVNRVDLLQRLEMLQPGLSTKGVLDQSNCFIFANDGVATFNGEVACFQKGLDGVTGAVVASPVLSQLGKWVEDEVEVYVDDAVLRVNGARRRAWFNLEAEIHLPVESIEKPGEWRDLPPNFGGAIGLVESCAGKDQNKFQATCVHLHPEWVEATDNVQVARYTVRTGIERTLVRATAIRSVASLGMVQWSQSQGWVHFRNAAGLVYSCVTYNEEYPDTSGVLVVEGAKMTFPKTLQDTIDKAEIFSRESEGNQLTVSLLPGRLRVMGEGRTGGFSEVKDIQYEGQPMSFTIDPKMLKEIVRDHNEVYVSEDKLVVDGGAFVYRTSLGRVEDEK